MLNRPDLYITSATGSLKCQTLSNVRYAYYLFTYSNIPHYIFFLELFLCFLIYFIYRSSTFLCLSMPHTQHYWRRSTHTAATLSLSLSLSLSFSLSLSLSHTHTNTILSTSCQVSPFLPFSFLISRLLFSQTHRRLKAAKLSSVIFFI